MTPNVGGGRRIAEYLDGSESRELRVFSGDIPVEKRSIFGT
jgi:hypothetical protein